MIITAWRLSGLGGWSVERATTTAPRRRPRANNEGDPRRGAAMIITASRPCGLGGALGMRANGQGGFFVECVGAIIRAIDVAGGQRSPEVA